MLRASAITGAIQCTSIPYFTSLFMGMCLLNPGIIKFYMNLYRNAQVGVDGAGGFKILAKLRFMKQQLRTNRDNPSRP